MPSEHDVKITAPPEVCTKDKQHAIVHFFMSEGMEGAEVHQSLAAKNGQNCLPE
jgi:hypothetical protein